LIIDGYIFYNKECVLPSNVSFPKDLRPFKKCDDKTMTPPAMAEINP
jgi:hypothetical protein